MESTKRLAPAYRYKYGVSRYVSPDMGDIRVDIRYKPRKGPNMTRTRTIALLIMILILGTNVFGDDISPNEVLQQVAATYKAMKTYKAQGTITADIDTRGMKLKTETSFSILLKKPNLYLISWTQKNTP
ncbi:MAG: hypothetical protein ACYTFA_18635, partial [Planctomycetota bacterium]